MGKFMGVFFLLFVMPSWVRAQGLSTPFSTSYNTVTVNGNADAGWSNDFDASCGFVSQWPYLPYTLNGLSYQVDNGPSNSNVGFSQISFADNCYGTRDNQYTFQITFADTAPGNRHLVVQGNFGDGSTSPTSTNNLYYTVPGATAQPVYYIVSIVCDPPGNLSSNGFTNSTSTGTTTGVTQAFDQGTTLTFSASFLLGTEWSFGVSHGSGTSDSFEETHTTGHGSQISSVRNQINRAQDRIYLWLNPQVTFVQSGANSANYTLSTPNGQPMDILDFSVADLQNPSQIPPEKCNPYILNGVTVPGVCNICADPSNCTAADFAPIVAQDLLAAPNADPIPSNNGTNRYVFVSTTYMDAPDAGGNPVYNSFTASDSNLQSQTFTQTHSYSVGFGRGGGFSLFGAFSLQIKDSTTLTWTDSQSEGTSSGTSHEAAVTLSTSTVGCNSGIDVYEDTVYHTFIPVPSSPLPAACGQ